jgi:signal transduction histidine kinase
MVLVCTLALQICGQVPKTLAADPQTLTTAREVHALSSALARQGFPVTLTATVTYCDRVGSTFVSDATGGIFVIPPTGQSTLQFGMIVTVVGVTGPGDFAPVVRATSITPTGLVTQPPPHAVSFEDLASGSEDCEWVEFRGVVRTAALNTDTGFPEMRIAAGGGQLRIHIAGMDIITNLDRFVDARVRVRGAVGGIFNQKRQLVAAKLFVPSPDQIIVEEPPPTAPFDVPTLAIKSLLQYTTRSSYGHRVKLRGTVTLSQRPRSVFIRDKTQGLEIQPQIAPDLAVGDEIEAIGFPVVGEWTPMLQDAVIRKVGAGSPPGSVLITAHEALEGSFDSELVRINARLLDYIPRRGVDMLVLQSGDVLFNALLQSAFSPGLLAGVPRGADIQLVGICQVQVGGPEKYRQSFRLLLRDRADVLILRRPPWWTQAKILWVLTVITAVLLLVLCWVFVLKRRVLAQTQVIRQKLQQEAVLQERTRIAREFHDTIEQEMIGINMQVDAVRAKIKTAPDLAEAGLHLAGRMIRRTISEARRSVLDLRSRALEQGDLASALAEVAKPVISGQSIHFQVEQSGVVRRLPALLEDNLLRIGQEAITNTIKHAGASNLILRLDYEPDKFSLRVRDDGCGFYEPELAGAASGHFGFLGMRERAARIRAHLVINSVLQSGTEIIVEVPLNPLPANHNETRSLQNNLS